MSDTKPATPDELLAHEGWLRRLARGLVAGEDRADDVVQETWLAATRRPPAHTRGLRGWLATVARNAARQIGRSEARRATREETAAAAPRPGVLDPSEVVSRLELRRRIAAEVLDLDEPYRTTLVLRYFDELTLREVAERFGVPESTVATRISRGLERLRRRLDDGHGGDRRAWTMVLLPMLMPRLPAVTAAAGLGAATTGALLMGTKLKIGIAAALVLLVGATVWFSTAPGAKAPARATEEAAPPEIPAVAEAEPTPTPEPAAPTGACTIYGTVTRDGRPVPARIEVRSAPYILGSAALLRASEFDPPVAIADAGKDGEYVVRDLERGRYEVVARSRDGRWAREQAVPGVGGPHYRLDLRLTGGSESLVGRAVTTDGEPFDGLVMVWTTRDFRTGRGCWSVAVSTDETGRFRLDGLPAGQVGVSFLRPGKWRSIFWAVPLPSRSERVFVVDDGLAPCMGRAIDEATEEPIAGARVAFRSGGDQCPREIVGKTETGADGSFTCRVPVGTGSLWVLKEGFAPAQISEKELDGIVVRLERRGIVTGVVRAKADGRPLPGVPVRAWNWYTHGMEDPIAVSDADGRFSGEVGPGKGWVYVCGDGWVSEGLSKLTSSAREVPLYVTADSGQTTEVVLEVVPAGRLEGTVTNEDGSPAARTPVGLSHRQGWRGFNQCFLIPDTANTVTDDEGRFRLDTLVPGFPYLVTGSPADSPSVQTGPVAVASGETATVEIRFASLRSLTVKVVEAGSGEPLAGSRVSVTPAAGNALSGTTGPDGTVVVAGLAPGQASVGARHAGYLSEGGGHFGSSPGTVVPEPWPDEVVIELTRGAFVAGRIRGPDGKPPRDGWVSLYAVGTSPAPFGGVGIGGMSPVEGDGSFRRGPVPAGTYDLVLVTGDFPDQEFVGRWTVETGQEGLELTIDPREKEEEEQRVVRLRVTGPDGRPARGSMVWLRSSRRRLSPALWKGDLVECRGLEPGERFYAEFCSPRDADGELLGGGIYGPLTARPVEQLVKLRAARTIEGRVVDEEGAAVAGLLVRAEPVAPEALGVVGGSGALPRARTDAEGRFRIEGTGEERQRLLMDVSEGRALADPPVVEPGATDVVVTLSPGTEVEIRVEDAEGRPVAGARVSARLRTASELTRAGESDTTGTVRLRGLSAAAVYDLSIEPPADRADLVEIRRSGWRPAGGALAFSPGGEVRGTVRTKASPCPAANVWWKCGDEWRSVAADRFGGFRIVAPKGKAVALRAAPPGGPLPGPDGEVEVDAGARDVVLTITK